MKPWTSAGWHRSACGGTQRVLKGPVKNNLPAPLKGKGSSTVEERAGREVMPRTHMRTSRFPLLPRAEVIWSIMPQGAPTTWFSTF